MFKFEFEEIMKEIIDKIMEDIMEDGVMCLDG
jgi:hypothetical protein